ncbi:MAG: murein L,D-transpeptidase [Chloroflexi bacterium]|uniref:L,D-TPase catalytic domain-containing protein n=2 Tax=Candidatus Thermofonsia Clade 3 TaxID=2364209 RepID=A0A2M8QG18_9CHLR|nr:MAG: hypothetical protein CUN48_01955 [Candidatus Thermofonsia Clade 3 bacterium]RMG62939.1 MAG: murein L,D-transpeptidase [Chloroflexota bacterium]
MALLLAAVPLVVSAERRAQPAAQRLAREAAQPQSRQVTAPEDARPAASAPVLAAAPTPPTAPSSRVAAVAQAPAQPVHVQPTVAASLPQDAPDAAVYDAKSVPTRRGKWIEVILDEQRLIAWEDGRMVMTTLVSTGAQDTPTVRGIFRIYRKLDSQHMRGRGYDLPNVPYVMYFKGGYALHGTYWHNNFGQPMSHGCVNIPIGKAAWLYGWAPQGTVVVVH